MSACSPFFPAFQNGLVQHPQLAEAIFAFTDAIPGAEIGAALQTVSLLSNSLTSEVDMTVFPGITGTVVTSSRLTVGVGLRAGAKGAGGVSRSWCRECGLWQCADGWKGARGLVDGAAIEQQPDE